MDKLFVLLLAIVVGLIPDFIMALFVQWFGANTGIQYLADGSFWQAFWLSLIFTTAVSLTISFSAITTELQDV